MLGHQRGTRLRAARAGLLAIAAGLIILAAKGALDTFYISPTREQLAQAQAGERLIMIAALLLLAVAAGFAIAGLPLTAVVTAVAAVVFRGVVALPDVTVMTYLMTPVAAVLVAAATAVDLTWLKR